jgi:hypothetical protein
MYALASFLGLSDGNYATDSGLEQSPKVNVQERTSRRLTELDILRMRSDFAREYYWTFSGPNSRLHFEAHNKVF